MNYAYANAHKSNFVTDVDVPDDSYVATRVLAAHLTKCCECTGLFRCDTFERLKRILAPQRRDTRLGAKFRDRHKPK